MKVTALTRHLHASYGSSPVPAWYIDMRNHKILFITGESDDVLQSAQESGIAMDEIDFLFFSWECRDSIHELEYFFRHNTKAKIYLARANNEARLHSLFNKLDSYSDSSLANSGQNRIFFMDSSMDIEEDIQVVSDDSSQAMPSHNLLLSEDSAWVLFTNDTRKGSALTQTFSDSSHGQPIHYLYGTMDGE
jgi:metal-dependent hydrolase (beta-lactamase superfamily II)